MYVIQISLAGYILLMVALTNFFMLLYVAIAVTRAVQYIKRSKRIRPIDNIKENYDYLSVSTEPKPEHVDGTERS